MAARSRQKAHEIFGISNTVLPDSYVDRGGLDGRLRTYLERPTHIALHGESLCGKSWLRQTVLPDALVVQCRLEKTTLDIYRDALSQLEVRLDLETVHGSQWTGRVETEGDLGIKLLARLGVMTAMEAEKARETKSASVGHDVADLRFVADLLKASRRKLVIEDFHYLSLEQRRVAAVDLKALWDYGVFVVVIGTWREPDLLALLNPDLRGRVCNLELTWGDQDLREIMRRGGEALNIQFSEEIQEHAIDACYFNAGILQRLLLGLLDELKVRETRRKPLLVHELNELVLQELLRPTEIEGRYEAPIFNGLLNEGTVGRRDQST